MNKTQLAVTRFEEGFNCSQAVFSVYAEELGLDKETALKISGTFGGGISRTGQTCGAVTGAIMALGLKFGATDAADKTTKEQAYSRAQEFARRFEARNEAITCKELLGCDISTPDGHKMAKELGLYGKICPKLVKDAAEIVEELLAE